MRTAAPLHLPLFRSASQERVLSALFLTDGRKSIQDLSELLDIPYATVHREIGRLLQAGLVVEERVGNSRLVGSNKKSPYYQPLYKLLEISSGPVPLLKRALEGIKGVEKVLIFGSWAHRMLGNRGPAPEDIDVLVIGEPDVRKVYAACSGVSKQLGWIVNPTIMSIKEWQTDTPFLQSVHKGGFLSVIGELNSKML